MGRSSLTKLHKSCGMTVVDMLTGGFEYQVEQAGGVFLGLSVRPNIGHCLIVIRADFEGKRMVAFVSHTTAAQSITKASRELRNGGLRWRPDKFA